MNVILHPDPQHPAGGYGFLELPEGSLGAGPVSVAVLDRYTERWLAPSTGDDHQVAIGDANWQSDRHEFGPYEILNHDGADWVRIGPEIVNKIEEYAPVRLVLGAQEYDIAWPDFLPPRAGAALLGGIRSTDRETQPEDLSDQLVGQAVDEPTEEEAIEDDVTIVAPPPRPEPEPEEPKQRRLLIPLLLLLLLIPAGAAAWWFWLRDDPVQVAKETAAPITQPVAITPTAGGEGCTLADLSALEGGFSVVEAAMRECGRKISPDVALSLIETAATGGDGDALLLFGTLYDGETLDARVENLIGLSFDDSAAQAAEYYARARDAGAGAAAEKLSEVCGRLEQSGATLDKGAFDDFCK
jgi:hypothetical protein